MKNQHASLLISTICALSAASAQAQVTISGSMSVGYQSNHVTASPGKTPGSAAFAQALGLKNSAGAGLLALAGGTGAGFGPNSSGAYTYANTLAVGNSSGLGVNTEATQITFATTEDLGDGYKVAASMQLMPGNTGSASAGGDSFMRLTTPAGLMTLRVATNTEYLSRGLSGVGAPALDNKVFPQIAFQKSIGYAVPVGSWTFAVNRANPGTALGLGTGDEGDASVVGQHSNTLAVAYRDGALTANVQYLAYDNQTANYDGTYANIARTQAAYDAGFAKFGGGYQFVTLSSGGTATMALLAVSVPLANWTLTADFGQLTVNGTRGNLQASGLPNTVNPTPGLYDQTRSGYGLGVNYAFSKKTNAQLEYTNWLEYAGAPDRNYQTRLLLTQMF